MGAAVWFVIAGLLLVIELSVTMMVFVWFAVGALAVAAAAALGLSSLPWQLLLFCAVSAPLVVGSRTIFRRWLLRRSPGAEVRTNAGALPGHAGRVVVPIAGPEGGRVSLQGMDWAARSADGSPIAAGAAVRVVEVQDVTLIVEVEPDNGG